MMDTDSENDIWNFKSLKRRRSKIRTKTSTRSSRSSSTTRTPMPPTKKKHTKYKYSDDHDENLPNSIKKEYFKKSPSSSKSSVQTKLERFSPVKTTSSQRLPTLTNSKTKSKSKSKSKNKNRDKTSAPKQAKTSRKSSMVKTRTSRRRGTGSQQDVTKMDAKSGCQDVSGNKKGEKAYKVQDYCPCCQMPYSVIVNDSVSPEDHVMECIGMAQPESECAFGEACDVADKDHFSQLSHFKLAEARARISSDRQASQKPGARKRNSNEKAVDNNLRMPAKKTRLVYDSMPVKEARPVSSQETYMYVAAKNSDLSDLATPAVETRLVSSQANNDGDSANESQYLASDEDIFDTQPTQQMPERLPAGSPQWRVSPFENTEDGDLQSSAQSEMSTSVLAELGPTFEISQLQSDRLPPPQTWPSCPEAGKTRDCDRRVIPSTRSTCKSDSTATVSHQNDDRKAPSFPSNSGRLSRDQNVSLDFDRCSQVDISIKVTPCRDKLSSSQSFFKMKANKARHIQVILEENQDSESDCEALSSCSAGVPPVQEANTKQPQAQDVLDGCHGEHVERCSAENTDSDCFVDGFALKSGTSTFVILPAQDDLANTVPPTSNSVHPTNSTAKGNTTITKLEFVENLDGKHLKCDGDTSTHPPPQPSTFTRILSPVTRAVSKVVPTSSSLKQSSLASYFGWGSVIKQKEMSQESPKLSISKPAAVHQERGVRDRKMNPGPVKGAFPQFPLDNDTQPSGQQSYSGNSSKRQCPFYKKMPGTVFVVDAFHYGSIPGVSAYFLSHFHYDHYRGLTKHFRHPIYCSRITANLVKSRIRVAATWIHSLPMNEACVLCGVEVTLLEANHYCSSSLLQSLCQQGQEEYSRLPTERLPAIHADS